MAKKTASAVCDSCCITPEFRGTERTEIRIRSAHEEEEEEEEEKETTKETASVVCNSCCNSTRIPRN